MLRALIGWCWVVWAIGPARAGTDPDRHWVSITSEHFALHTYDGGVALAGDALAYLEDAYVVVGETLGWKPRARVHVTLIDDVDSANGLAVTLPWPGITLYAWPPEPESELGDYVNWLRLLCFHEYTHIAHIDTAFGLPEIVNKLVGPIWAPNDALPRWATEGMAVWIESTKAGGGRVGSTLSEMHMRAAALAGRQPDLAELTGYTLQYPRAASWYIYGGYVYDAIARARGEDAVKSFSHGYASRPIPFGLNAVARETTGKTLVDWYGDVLAAARARAFAHRDAVWAEGAREGLALTSSGEVQIEPRFSPDGRWLSWIRTTGHDAMRIVRREVAGLEPLGDGDDEIAPEPVVTCEGGCGPYTFTRDGTRLVFGTTRHHKVGNFHGVLAEVAFEGGQWRKSPRVLGDVRRAHDPAMAADGRSVWLVQTAWGTPALVRVDLPTGDVLERWQEGAASHPRIDRPAPSPDGKSIYLSIHRGGNRDLYRLDLVTRALEQLTTGRAMELQPSLTTDGRWLVYTADPDGVFDIYARDVTSGETRRLTRVMHGAHYPTVSPDGKLLVFSSWSLRGWDLRVMPFAPEAAPLVSPTSWPAASANETSPPTAMSKPAPYHPLATLVPRSYLPDLTIDSTGLSRVAFEVDALDASNRYGLALGVDWDPHGERWSAWMNAFLALGYPDLSLGVGRYSYARESYVGDVTEPYEQEVVYGQVGVSFPLPDVFSGASLGLGYTIDVARGYEVGRLEHTPEESTTFIPYEGASTALNISVGMNDVRQFVFSPAPAEGISAFFNFALRHPALGSAGESWAFTWVTHAYVGVPGLARWDHVLGFRFGGGIAGGEPGQRGGFALGGVPRQDLLSDLLNQTSAGSAWMRGFAPDAFVGSAFMLGTAEYRMPLVRVRSGLGTLPVYVEDLGLAAFADVGGATYDTSFPVDALHVGLGAELRVRLELFYGLAADLRLGYARGLGDQGIDHFYLLMAGIP